jgi:translation initiation factor IF-2
VAGPPTTPDPALEVALLTEPGKMRVYELAKSLNLDSKRLIDLMRRLKMDVRNHMSTLDQETIDRVTEIVMGRKREATEATPEPPVVLGSGGRPTGGTPPPKRERREPPLPTKRPEPNRVISGPRRPQPLPGETAPDEEEDTVLLYEEDRATPRRVPVRSQKRPEETRGPSRRKIISSPREKGRAPGHGGPRGRTPLRGPVPVPERRTVVVEGPLTVMGVSQHFGIPVAEVIKKLMQLGVMATINQEVDADTQELLAHEFGLQVEVKAQGPSLEEELLTPTPDAPESLQPRAPVVTVMGHVDHGKTSLLDTIRSSRVTAQEAGGITQHIGAYSVPVKGRRVVFLDTPGHEAFTAMRARGAQVTDIAVLVVAADDGVMPQTIEALNHARAAGVPIVVAINKIDKPDADPNRVMQQLAEHGLVPEEWGGDTVMVPVSARTGQGVDQLLEMLLLVADLRELRANPDKPARGVIIEARLDRGRGPVATLLVQEGTLHVGDNYVVGSVFGRVRALLDDKGKPVKKAGPSTPVEVLGLPAVPEAGDVFIAVQDEKKGRLLAEQRAEQAHRRGLSGESRSTLQDLFQKIEAGEAQELRIVLKADVHGSLEALHQALERLSTDAVKVRVLHEGVGAISESDVSLAAASSALVVGFNVRPDPQGRKAAEERHVDVRTYRVIYEVIEDIEAALKGMTAPEIKEVVLGHAQVREVFRIPKAGVVAGSYVTDGKVTRQGRVRVVRDGTIIYDGRVQSLRRFKDDVREVGQGLECGIAIERFQDIKEGDVLEVYTLEEVPA